MLDPNEWTLVFAAAIVPKRHRYVEAEPLKFVGEDGRFMRVHARIFNGSRLGEAETVDAVGAMENQSRAVLENLIAAAENIEPRHDRTQRAVVVGANYEPTLQEIWKD